MRLLCDYYILSIGNPYPFFDKYGKRGDYAPCFVFANCNDYDLDIVFYFYHISQLPSNLFFPG
jgi:hypothetical protein